jgi:phospholipase/carboxylesterase
MKFWLANFLVATIMNTTVVNKTPLIYLVREPKIKIEKPPLLILLHGVGSNEKDLFSFADNLPDKFLVISARAPIVLGPNSFAWYQVDFSTGKPIFNKEQETNSRKVILEFINELKHYHSFDAQQIYLCGFSQGAIMSYSVGLTHPEKIKGIAIMSGRLLEEIKPLVTKSSELAKLKIFISHGTSDGTLTVEYARESLAYLKGLNLNPTYKEYNEGHGINNENLSDLINWISKN